MNEPMRGTLPATALSGAERTVIWIVMALMLAAFASVATWLPRRADAVNDWFRVADWLINYGGGFVRRGFLGGFFVRIGEWSGIMPGQLVLGFVAVLYAVIFWFSTRIFVTHKVTFSRLLVFLSPAFLLFCVYDLKGGYRKEILFLAFYSAGVYFGLVRQRFSRPIAWLPVLFMPAIILTHEVLFCALPFVVLLILLTRLSLSERLWASVSTVAVSGLAVLAVLRAGSADPVAICAPLLAQGHSQHLCDGAIKALSLKTVDGLDVVRERILTTSLFWQYLLGAVLSAFPLALALKEQQRLDGHRRYALWVGMACAASLLLLLPVFLVATDWGRFIYLVVGCMSLLALARPAPGNGRLDGPRIHLGLLVAVIYCGLWNIDHFQGMEGVLAHLLWRN